MIRDSGPVIDHLAWRPGMAPMFGVQGSQIALLLGIGLFVFVLLKRLRRGFGETRPIRSAGQRAASRSAAASRQHESWEVEMHAIARQLKGEIDTKMRAMERLIETADEAHRQLSATMDRAESLGLFEERAMASAAVEENESDLYGSTPAAATVRKVSAPRGAVSSGRLRFGEDPADDPRFERVYALADAGFSASRIASQVGSQVGEVELILSLRRG
jgi:hypothetical protein